MLLLARIERHAAGFPSPSCDLRRPRTWAAVSISCWLSLERSCPIAAISALQLGLGLGGAVLLGAGGLEFLRPLLDRVR